MEGSVFILFDKGWACSNSCEIDLEKDVSLQDRTSIATTVLKIKGIFTNKNVLLPDTPVLLVFKQEDSEKEENIGFNGLVRAVTEKKTTIVLSTKNNRVNEILTKIQEEIHNGR